MRLYGCPREPLDPRFAEYDTECPACGGLLVLLLTIDPRWVVDPETGASSFDVNMTLDEAATLARHNCRPPGGGEPLSLSVAA
jgi:hypothetical protein